MKIKVTFGATLKFMLAFVFLTSILIGCEKEKDNKPIKKTPKTEDPKDDPKDDEEDDRIDYFHLTISGAFDTVLTGKNIILERMVGRIYQIAFENEFVMFPTHPFAIYISPNVFFRDSTRSNVAFNPFPTKSINSLITGIPGEYDIKLDTLENENEPFSCHTYSDIRYLHRIFGGKEDNKQNGTLTILPSDDGHIKGEFEFEAYEINGEPDSKINVVGNFIADTDF